MKGLLPPPGRRDDSRDAHGWQDLLRMRRVREQDESAQASSLQAQRCMAHMKTHSWRTSATMIAAATVVVVSGMFAWGTAEHDEIRSASAMIAHRHSEIALSRELETLRNRLVSQLEMINRKIDRLSEATLARPAPPAQATRP